MKFYDFGDAPKKNKTTGIIFEGFSDNDRKSTKNEQTETIHPIVKTYSPIDDVYSNKVIQDITYASKQNGSYPNLPQRQGTDKSLRCELLLYSPRKNHPHMVRSQVYNFNQFAAVDNMNNNHRNNDPILNNSMFDQIPELNGMIMPSNNGHIVDLTKLDDCWTFTFIFDSEQIDGYKSHQTTCRMKTISTGYCLSEPVNPITQTVNPMSIFKFSHHTKFRFNRNREGNYFSKPEVIGNYDIIPTEFKSMVDQNSDDLVNLSPQYLNPPDPKIFANKYLNDINFKRDDYDDCVVDVLTGIPRHTASKIHADLKSSKKHLHTITHALDQAKAAVDCRDDIDYSNIASTVSTYGGTIGVYDMFYKKLGDQKPIIESGVTGYEVKAFSDLLHMYPAMNIKVLPIKNSRNWDVYPSHLNNINNNYNSWISSFLNQFCEAAGIMELVFIYDSYCGNQFEKEGRWNITKLDSIYGDDVEYGKMLFHSLKRELQSHIFNFFKHSIGDFSLFVNYRSFTDTAINLQFYGEEKINACYETPTDKPGLISPLIGDKDYAVRNGEEVAMLLTRFDVD